MDVVAEGFSDEVFGDAEAVGQVPDLGAAAGDGFVQVFHRDQGLDGPFVGAVFVALAAVYGCVNIIEAAGKAMAQLVAQVDALLGAAVADAFVHADGAAAGVRHDGHGAVLGQGKGDDLYILLCGKIIEGP